ncbi:MAG: hypothetical protein WC702_00890 [Patescibacteria group bacterium]|jgi:4-hydroxybenzoate polyprenyltransferase
MKLELPEPHVFGQGDALACLVIWLMGVAILVFCFLGWITGMKIDGYIICLGLTSVVAPFGLMFYKAHLRIKYEDEKSGK